MIIINADDFGLTQGVNDAILHLAELKTISSTTVMVNQPRGEQAIELLCFKKFGIGLHFTLTEGIPISPPEKIPSLVNAQGKFYTQQLFRERERKRKIRSEDVLIELTAQISRLEEWVGSRWDHLDSHQNIHKSSTVANAFMQWGLQNPGSGLRAPQRFLLSTKQREYQVQCGWGYSLRKARLRRALAEIYLARLTDRYQKVFKTPRGELQGLERGKINLLKALSHSYGVCSGTGTYEIACHPSIHTKGLGESKLKEQRVEEYHHFASTEFQEFTKAFPLTTFSTL